MNEQLSPVETKPPNNNRTILWIVGGVIALCVCAAVGVVVLAGGFLFLNRSAVSNGDITIFQPTAEEPSAGSDDEVGVTMDIPDGGTNHVEVGTPVEYTSNPPSSGSHYGRWLEAGFYDV